MIPSLTVKYFGVPPSPVLPCHPSRSVPLKSFTGFSPSGNLTEADQSASFLSLSSACNVDLKSNAADSEANASENNRFFFMGWLRERREWRQSETASMTLCPARRK